MEFEQNTDGLILPVEGLVTVDLCDRDTGKVVQREEAKNFLSLQSIKAAKWGQRMLWGAFCPVETNDAVGNKPSEQPWFPAQHLAYWNDATTEAPSTEDVIQGAIVGWASRHPIGSPTGKRGVVDIGESDFRDAYAKWVFNWTASQGNGTFQSVGWTRLDESSVVPIPGYPDDASIAFTNLGISEASGGAGLWWDATNSLWNITERISSSQFRIASTAAGGGTTTQICALPGSSAEWGSSTYPIRGIARIGTDFICCGANTIGQLTRHNVSGTLTWKRLEAAAPYWLDVTIDGSGDIWTAGSDGKIRKHSVSDGTVTTAVTLTGLVPSLLSGIAYDPADGLFWVCGTLAGRERQIWKVNSSGAQQLTTPEFSLYAQSANNAQSSSSPYAGSYYIPTASARESYQRNYFLYNTGTAGIIARHPPVRQAYSYLGSWVTVGNLCMKGTELWYSAPISSVGGGAAKASQVRNTLGTRSLLASPVTKTGSQTLKITYQFNFS